MTERKPLMPKATAVWLVDNTALTFDQIAHFCGLHVLEVKGIADGDVAHGIKGMDPISNGQLTREEIQRGEKDAAYTLKIAEPKVALPQVTTRKKGPRYTPVSRRQDRPNAVLWLLRNHPEMRDSQIIRLVGTTKPTIAQIRDRSHWNTPNLQPQDPVTLGLCSQIDLDAEVQKAAARAAKERADAGIVDEPAGSLLPTSETTDYDVSAPGAEQPSTPSDAEEDARVFAKLKSMTRATDEEDAEAAEAAAQTAENVFGQRPRPEPEAETESDGPDPEAVFGDGAGQGDEAPEEDVDSEGEAEDDANTDDGRT